MTPEELADLHRQSFQVPRPWSADEFRGLLQSTNIELFSRPAGFLLARFAGPEAEILTLAVDPARRRGGTGRALVAAFLERAAQNGAEAAFLEVAADNAAAIALYQSAGFREGGMRKDYYRSPRGAKVSALVMRRDIASA